MRDSVNHVRPGFVRRSIDGESFRVLCSSSDGVDKGDVDADAAVSVFEVYVAGRCERQSDLGILSPRWRRRGEAWLKIRRSC